MSCDIHVRTEIRTDVATADRQAALAAGLAEVNRRMSEFDLDGGSPLLSTGYDDFADLSRLLAAQLSQLGTREVTRAWILAEGAFESHHLHGPDLPVSRPLLEALTDGQLLDVAAEWLQHSGQSEAGGAQLLTLGAASALDAHSTRVASTDAVLSHMREQRWDDGEAQGDFGAAADDCDTDDDLVAAARLLATARREPASIEDADRESLVAALLEYRRTDGGPAIVSYERGKDDPPHRTSDPWRGRNYDLFAMLANIRNERRWDGAPAGAGFAPIDDARGYPHDVSPEGGLFLTSDCYALIHGFCGFGHSWVTLTELLAYDWDGQRTLKEGVVTADEYERCASNGDRPREWSAGVGPRAVTLSEPGYAAWKLAGRPDLGSGAVLADSAPLAETAAGSWQPHVRMQWEITYRDAAGQWFFGLLDRLTDLVPADGTTDDVRLIFYFMS